MALSNRQYNFVLLGVVLFLLGIGLVMVYSASHHMALKEFNDGGLFFRKHFYRVLIGLAALVVAALIPYRFWLKTSRLWLLIGIILLIIVLVTGYNAGNATRWLRIKGVRFQPIEFVRLAWIFYLADAMVRKQDYLDHFKEGVLPQMLVLGIILLLLQQQPDLGSAVILLLITGVILTTAGVKWSHLGFLAILASPALLLIKPYQIKRLTSYIDSVFHGQPLSYHVHQSLISLGNGGLLGKGLDNSTQKMDFLPTPFTDFIFAIVGEEFGFIGALVLLTLILYVVLEGFRIAHRSEDEGGAILAAGISASIGLYAFLNAGVVCNLLPTKGLPFPFISYGGSFMISNLFALGILLNISQHVFFKPIRGKVSESYDSPGSRKKFLRREV